MPAAPSQPGPWRWLPGRRVHSIAALELLLQLWPLGGQSVGSLEKQLGRDGEELGGARGGVGPDQAGLRAREASTQRVKLVAHHARPDLLELAAPDIGRTIGGAGVLIELMCEFV